MTKKLAFILPLAIAASVATGASGAPDPSVAPCTGISATDPKGDDTIQPLAVPISGPHSTVGENPNVDIREVYFTYRPGADGAPQLTGYLKVTDLSKAVPEGSPDDVSWFVEFDRLENSLTSVKATSDGTEVKFYYTMQEAAVPGVLNQPVEYIESTGKFVEGPDGVVAIDFPKDLAPKVGEKLTGVFGMTTYNSSSTDPGARTFADRAPDDGAASEKTYTVTPCPAAAAPSGNATPTASPGAGPTAGPPPPGAGQPSQQGQPAPTPASKPKAKKKKKKASCKKKAKKIKNAKKRKKALKRCAKKKKKKRRR